MIECILDNDCLPGSDCLDKIDPEYLYFHGAVLGIESC